MRMPHDQMQAVESASSAASAAARSEACIECRAQQQILGRVAGSDSSGVTAPGRPRDGARAASMMRPRLPSKSPTVGLICASATCTCRDLMSTGGSEDADDYRMRVARRACGDRAAAWDALLDALARRPFMRHAFLAALHDRVAPASHRLAAAVPDACDAAACAAAAAVPEVPLLRRIRLRLGLGRCLRAPRSAPTTRSCWAPCPSPLCPGPPAGARAAARRRWPARCSRRRRPRAVIAASAVHRRRPTARPARPAACCARACSSTGPTAARRTPTSTSFLARLQRDKRKKIRGAPQGGRGRASVRRCTGHGIDEARLGLLLPLLPHTYARTMHALPEPRLLPALAETMPEHW